MSRSQFHSISCLYLDMHGLIFETSVWLLAGSTRLLCFVFFPIHILSNTNDKKIMFSIFLIS